MRKLSIFLTAWIYGALFFWVNLALVVLYTPWPLDLIKTKLEADPRVQIGTIEGTLANGIKIMDFHITGEDGSALKFGLVELDYSSLRLSPQMREIVLDRIHVKDATLLLKDANPGEIAIGLATGKMAPQTDAPPKIVKVESTKAANKLKLPVRIEEIIIENLTVGGAPAEKKPEQFAAAFMGLPTGIVIEKLVIGQLELIPGATLPVVRMKSATLVSKELDFEMGAWAYDSKKGLSIQGQVEGALKLESFKVLTKPITFSIKPFKDESGSGVQAELFDGQVKGKWGPGVEVEMANFQFTEWVTLSSILGLGPRRIVQMKMKSPDRSIFPVKASWFETFEVNEGTAVFHLMPRSPETVSEDLYLRSQLASDLSADVPVPSESLKFLAWLAGSGVKREVIEETKEAPKLPYQAQQGLPARAKPPVQRIPASKGLRIPAKRAK